MIPVMLIAGWVVIISVTVWFIVSEIKRYKQRKEDSLYEWADDIFDKIIGDTALDLVFTLLWAYILLSFLTYVNWEKFL